MKSDDQLNDEMCKPDYKQAGSSPFLSGSQAVAQGCWRGFKKVYMVGGQAKFRNNEDKLSNYTKLKQSLGGPQKKSQQWYINELLRFLIMNFRLCYDNGYASVNPNVADQIASLVDKTAKFHVITVWACLTFIKQLLIAGCAISRLVWVRQFSDVIAKLLFALPTK